MSAADRPPDAPLAGPSSALHEVPRDEAHRAYREGRAIAFPLAGLGPLRLTGADRVDFLQGQVSCDVRRLEPGGTVEGLLLNHKGHALAQLRVVRRSDDLYVAVDAGAGSLVAAEFERHIVFDAVEVEDLGDALVGWSLQGHPAAVGEVLAAVDAAPPQPGTSASVPFDDASLLVVPTRRSGAGGVDVHMLTRHGAGVIERWANAGAVVAGPEIADLLRVCAGIPHAAHEGGEGVLPQEAGLEPLVSYRKGCYLGQEIMARIEARGTLRRDLAALALDAEPAGRQVTLDERDVGRLGTVVRHPQLGWRALAVVRKDLPDDAELDAGGVSARIVPLPLEEPPG